jgi:membrane-bound lytic murein transglycosylase D
MRILLVSLLCCTVGILCAQQKPVVPSKMQVAGISLTIKEDAKKEIQKDVDALWQSPKHFFIKVERARTYFPLIEKVFREEGVPDDIKYLVIQESALIADAVSTSNAVGFWQFKDFTAIEMGLRVDKEIDERANIVAATRGAARYLKKNNTFFNNWLFAVQAYQMGAGGVMRSVNDTQKGATEMTINSETYWYVKKFIAHKIAFEGVVEGAGEIKLATIESKQKRTIQQLAAELQVDEAFLADYNKWMKKGYVPDDRPYTIAIPVRGDVIPTYDNPAYANTQTEVIKDQPVAIKKEYKQKINGIPTIIGRQGESMVMLANRANVDISSFLKWNDVSITDPVIIDQVYLLGKKRVRAEQAYHTVVKGDNLWNISQLYGLQLKRLKRYNRIDRDGELLTDMVLWLASSKPKNAKNNAKVPKKVIEVELEENFGWQDEPVKKDVMVIESTVVTTTPEVPTEPVVVKEPTETVVPVVEKEEEIIPKKEEVVEAQITKPVVQVPPVKPKDVIKPVEHVVVAGETLYGIAKIYGIGVMDLVNWNDLNVQDGIKPGQVLKLVGNQNVDEILPEVKPVRIEHEVKQTDTLYGIARKYGVTIQELMEWNNKKDFNLTIGERLTIMQK